MGRFKKAKKIKTNQKKTKKNKKIKKKQKKTINLSKNICTTASAQRGLSFCGLCLKEYWGGAGRAIKVVLVFLLVQIFLKLALIIVTITRWIKVPVSILRHEYHDWQLTKIFIIWMIPNLVNYFLKCCHLLSTVLSTVVNCCHLLAGFWSGALGDDDSSFSLCGIPRPTWTWRFSLWFCFKLSTVNVEIWGAWDGWGGTSFQRFCCFLNSSNNVTFLL